jgi:crossover junction endodeoxyribonuclease RuvC
LMTPKTTKRVLGLDLGTKCGWATAYEDGSCISAGVWNLSIGRFEGGGMRYLRFRQMLTSVLDGVKQVCYEEVRRHAGTTAAHVYGGLMAVLTEECERRSIPYGTVTVGALKKYATGKGNAGKPAMIAAAEAASLGFPIIDDNMADAIHIVRWATQQPIQTR